MIELNENNILSHVDINSPAITNLLNDWSNYVMANKDNILQNFKVQLPPGRKSDPNADIEHFMGDEYRQQIVDMGPAHDGFPEVGYYINLKPDQSRFTETADTDFQQDYMERYQALRDGLMFELGIKRNALCVVYPNEGFIGWHNNANASAYNLIFTFSESGDGYWEHLNPYTGKVERVNDVAGWQCKATYFGAYQENNPNTLIYHTAKTYGCWRSTVSFIFDRTHKEWWEQAIEEIETT